ncbi:transposase, IS605 OrfB family, central region [Haladaptatus litoreus]|uniref:Transposase, IS605 OrfB family, central region n=1 Tax=Haladaptatus litoreus TaxID=553468 RepID=A0A1N7DJS8_9EURY|nr:RNA-guided endonuclease TnpB family protein [Haladaptatus litoreus]SIR76129.1 transposase, IS605 OrfB family, central region [Haladaptatus litoreus]
MVETVTKTLQATFAPPTQGKAVRLRRLLTTYREALDEAFDSGADTMGGVSDVVTPYDLPYQAKAAMCSYVPKLRKTYNAREIDDEHPLRLTNQAAKFDRDESRHYEICWNVPQPGRGTNFWIPLRLNPEQESLWNCLLEGDAKAGQIQLQQNRRSWVFHIAAEYEVDEPDTDGDETHIGFDIGESALITGCALKRNTPTKPMLESGSRARHLRKEMYTTLKRLQQRDASEWRIDERFDHYQNALTDIVEKASRNAVEYARQFENPVIVLEDLSFIRERLDYGKYMNRRLHAWAFARLQGRIEDKATELGIPVRFVNPAYTSQTCHACGHIGRRGSQAEFRCTNDGCHVSTFQADINAAANIAGRVDPWGESVPWKPERDDTPQDGSGCDTATVHRKTSAKPAQMTLSAYSD